MQTTIRGNMSYFIDRWTVPPDGWYPGNKAFLEGLRATIRARRELVSTCRFFRLAVLEAWKRDISAIDITSPRASIGFAVAHEENRRKRVTAFLDGLIR